MRKARWLAEWRHSEQKPVFYHCISRVVDRRFVLGTDEKEKFRALMRVYEKFSGCRVTAYCLMDNHFHLLLEVPPIPEGGISDEELLKRLSALYGQAFVAGVAKELAETRQNVKDGRCDEGMVRRIHERFTYRMHDLGEFMKGLLQRYTQWHNGRHKRSGRLWEDRFKSVIVEDGVAARTMAAYIDLNPVRAGMVQEPAEYRWSSYGEAMGATGRSGVRAKAGLVRAYMAHKGWEADARHWSGRVAQEYRMMLLEEGEEKTREVVNPQGERVTQVVRKGISKDAGAGRMQFAGGGDDAECPAMSLRSIAATARALRCKVRYFTDGAVIGSRGFVDEVFARCRDRFGPKRTSGARKLRGDAAAMSGAIWSIRDLRKGTAG